MKSWGLWSPATATLALAASLGLGGLALVAGSADNPLMAGPPVLTSAALPVVLGLLFLLAELGLIHVEFRSQAWSFSLSGIPLVLGALWVEPRDLVLARVVGAAVAFTLQRPAPVKAGYNLAAYLFEAASVAALAHVVLDGGVQLTVGPAVLTYAVVAASDVAMSLLVLLIIGLHQGRVTRGEVLGVIVPGAVLGAVCTAVAFITVLLVRTGPLGCVMLACVAAAGGLSYRSFLGLRNRHLEMAMVHQFVADSGGADTVEELAGRLLRRTRSLLRAAHAELVLAGPGEDALRLVVGEDDGLTIDSRAGRTSDWLVSQVREHAEAVHVPRNTRDRAKQRWLTDHGLRDALLVPLTGPDADGVLVVLDRLGDTATFTTDDLALLQTLAGHLSVALTGTRLLQQLRHDAGHDVLTGLANRALLGERLRQELLGGRATEAPSVLLLDLDRFKEVNDALGHHVGDLLLKIVAHRLTGATPAGSVVARLGGDEFAVLLPSGPDPQGHADAVSVAIAAALDVPVPMEDAVLTTRASMGIAIGYAGLTDSDLLRHADTAMYSAKQTGQPTVVYTPELDRGRAESLALLADLHQGLERDELELHYQPLLDLRSGQVSGVEALVRWRHPRLGLLSPDAFIPLAESTGLIDTLTRVVLLRALRQARHWRGMGLDLTVAVNLSARNVNNAALPEEIARALVTVGVPADRLVLEITESSVMGDPHRTVPTLQRIADMGVTLSLDDFGTGYSSLSYLQRLPVQEVKIDRSFVAGLDHDRSRQASEALIRSIVLLGEGLGLSIVAEGVETPESLEDLRRLGCHVAQGFHIGRPGTPDELLGHLSRTTASRAPSLSIVAG